MAKGRKRKAGPRTRSGQLSRAGRTSDVRDVVLAQPHRAWIKDKDARTSQEAESTVGRAWLAKLISDPELWAAKRYLQLVDAFHSVMATPMTRQSAAAIGVAPGLELPAEAEPVPERPETPEERQTRVLEALNGVTGLLAQHPPKVKRELDAVVLRGEAISSLVHLRCGLFSLVWLWRLDSIEAPKRKTYWRSERPENMELVSE